MSDGRDPLVTVQSAGSDTDPQVRLVADTGTRDPQTIGARDLSVTLPDRTLPSRAVPLLSARSDVVVALDTTAAAAPGLAEVRSGITDLLLQLPPEARTGAVVTGARPRVLAPLGTGATGALARLSEVEASGQAADTGGAAATAVGLALRALGPSPVSARPAASVRPRLVVLQTSARDAGGESATALGERLRRASAVLEVVTGSGGSAYWRTAAEATGGLVAELRSGSGSASGSAEAAFSRISDALRHTFLVTFARPAAAVEGVSLRFGGAAGGAGAFVDLTTSGSSASIATSSVGASAAGDGASAGPGLGAVVYAVALVLVALAAALVLNGLRRRPRGAHEAGVPVRPVPAQARPAPSLAPPQAMEPEPASSPKSAAESAQEPSPESSPEPEPESAAVIEARRRARATAAAVAAAARAAAPLRPPVPERPHDEPGVQPRNQPGPDPGDDDVRRSDS